MKSNWSSSWGIRCPPTRGGIRFIIISPRLTQTDFDSQRFHRIPVWRSSSTILVRAIVAFLFSLSEMSRQSSSSGPMQVSSISAPVKWRKVLWPKFLNSGESRGGVAAPGFTRTHKLGVGHRAVVNLSKPIRTHISSGESFRGQLSLWTRRRIGNAYYSASAITSAHFLIAEWRPLGILPM